MSAHLNLVLRRNVVAVFQAFQMNHYCDSISFNDFAKIIANHLEKESIESAASTLLSSELIK
jgi:ferritin